MDVGSVIASLRTQRGLSRTAVARRAGLSVSFVSDVETGRKNPTVASLERICAGLGVSLAEFFRLEELPPHLARVLDAARALRPEQADRLAAFLVSLSAPERRKDNEEGYSEGPPPD